MANEPKVLEVGNEIPTEKVAGEQGLSSAKVGTEAKEITKSEDSPVGENHTNIKATPTGNTESRLLGSSQENVGGRYIEDTNPVGGFERSVGDKNIVNTITVDEVKALIKKYGGGGNTYTKEEINNIVETMRKGLYQEVDTTTYPTLEDFLASDGEEGIIYLYPVGNEGNNYYQYIWETGHNWISLGTTVVDLSDYYKKSEDIVPPTDNSKDVGSATKRIKDLYLAGKIKDGTNEFDYNSLGFPVISAPSSTTLSSDEVTRISKGAIILTSFLGYEKIVFFPIGNESFGENGGFALCVNNFTPDIRCYRINNQNVISLQDITTKRIGLQSIARFNGKNVPNYPSSTGTFVLKCVDGTLTWVAE